MPFDGQNFEYPVFSLEGLVQWLEGQEPETEYDFTNCRGKCLLDTYLHARGVKRTGRHYSDMVAVTTGISNGQRIDVSLERPWTYGGALARARAIMSPTPSQETGNDGNS